MNHCVRTTFISLWLLLTSSLSAQIGLSLPVINNITPGDFASFQIKVTGFDSIVGMQYVLRWDPAVFEYVSLSSFNLPELDTNDFGTTQALDSGLVRVLWSHSNLLGGVSIPDETTIFRLRLKAIGEVGTGSSVIFTQDLLTPFDIARANSDSSLTSFGMNDVTLVNGFGAIGYIVSADEIVDSDDLAVKIYPNPFSEKTFVQFDLKTTSDVSLFVTDESGRTVFEKTLPQLPPGQHGTEIVSPQLRQKGAYFLILRAGTRICTRPLFVF